MTPFDWYFWILICAAVLFILVVWVIGDHGPSDTIDLTNPKTHVIITGGSSGIGYSIARILVSKGCTVTIIGRDKTKLMQAQNEIVAENNKNNTPLIGNIRIAVADVSDSAQITEAINKACIDCNNRLDVLICSAGVSRPGRLEEIPLSSYESMTSINYLGVVYSTLAAMPFMKPQKSGRLIFISSLAGLAGMIGFAGYSPTKYAVRGFAESIHMELRPFNIFTTLVNPPDVDTPMLMQEMPFKPEETKLISEDGGLFKPEDIAKDVISSINSWRFMVNTGFDGWLLGVLSTGISTPSHSLLRSMVEIFLAGPLRVVGLVYLFIWNRICTQCHKKNN